MLLNYFFTSYVISFVSHPTLVLLQRLPLKVTEAHCCVLISQMALKHGLFP